MQIRIYALAKDLGYDSKEMVDLARKAGIKGKGSALASLTDEEASIVAESLGKSYPATTSRFAPATPENQTSPIVSTPQIPPSRDPERTLDRTTSSAMSLSNALGIDRIHVQLVELGSIVESLILCVLDTSSCGPTYRTETSFCELIDEAFGADFFASPTADELHQARITRNQIVHRSGHSFPKEGDIRKARNAFALAVLDLLEYCGEALKAEVLCEFSQYIPQNKAMHSEPPTSRVLNGAITPAAR